MSLNARRILNAIHDADHLLNDPGSGGLIDPFGDMQICELTTIASESRTLANPTKPGIRFTLRFKTDGGDCTITTSNGLNVIGDTQAVFADVGDLLELVSVSHTTGYRWEILVNTGSVALTGGTLTLPTGAVAAWYADQYSASPRRVIPNAFSSTAVSQNLFSAPRRLFNNTNYWSKTSLTITDDATAGPDGTSGEASTVVASAGNWFMGQAAGSNIPAGTYTLAVWAKRNTGTDQVFAFSKDNTATRSSVKTATDTWQRFTYTFTLAGATSPSTLMLCSSDGATTASLQICDLELFAGSSDLGTANGTNPVGHMYLGANHYDTQPAVASNELDLSNQGYGQVQLPANLNLSSGVTYIAITKKIAAGSAYHATLSKSQSFGHLTFSQEVSQAPQYWIGTEEAPNFRGTIESLNQGYFAWGWRYDGSSRHMLLNDHRLFTKAGAVTNQTFRDFNMGFVSSASLYAGEKFHASALWNRALSDEEYLQAYNYLVAQVEASGLSMGTERVVCFEGDSITGTDGSCWPYYYGINLANPKFLGSNFAISGSTIANLVTRAPDVDAVIPVDKGSRKFVLAVLVTNGLSDATTFSADLKAYLQARRSAGWTVVACTLLPRNDATHNARRATVNTTMRSWGTADGVDYLIDFAADATMGPDAAASDTLLYSDGTHPTTAGHQNLAAVAAAVLNAI